MRIWYHNTHANKRACVRIQGNQVRIGRAPGNDIVLPSPMVPEYALCLIRHRHGWELVNLTQAGCNVGGVRLRYGERAFLRETCQVQLPPFVLDIEPNLSDSRHSVTEQRRLDDRASELIRSIHKNLLEVVDVRRTDLARDAGGEAMMYLEHTIEELARKHQLEQPDNAELLSHLAGHAVRSVLIDQLLTELPGAQEATKTTQDWTLLVSTVEEREGELQGLNRQLRSELGLDQVAHLEQQLAILEQEFWRWWSRTVATRFREFLIYLALRYLKKQIKDIIYGYGPLQDLMQLPHISEIMVVGRNRIYIEKNGQIENTGRRFVTDEVVGAIIERIAGQAGRRIDQSLPLVDASLADGSRFHGALPPVSRSGPIITIRKFPEKRIRIADWIRDGGLSEPAAAFVRAAVINRRNILVSGATSSGKTTFLNCVADWIPPRERIITIEDTAELRLEHEHLVSMETKQPNAEGAGACTIQMLVRNALRMRPDRIIVGECRGGEALDMLQAMNTGHNGSLTTIHANSPADVITRLETMVQSASSLPVDAIHRQIASAIDLIIHVEKCGRQRSVASICEVSGLGSGRRPVEIKELFVLELVDGRATTEPTGHLPSFLGELLEARLYSMHGFYRTLPTPPKVTACSV